MEEGSKYAWGLCKCGCKCHRARLGGEDFAVFDDGKGTLYLDLGHHAGAGLLGTFTSLEDADREARRIIRPQFAHELARAKETAARQMAEA